MNIYLVNARGLHFSAKQLEAVTRLPRCADFGGIIEGVAWVRDVDGDIIILASEYRRDSFFTLLPRRYEPHHMREFSRAADYLMACGTDWMSGESPVKVWWGVTVAKVGISWLMCSEGDAMDQKALNVNQGKMNMYYKRSDDNDRS